MPVAPALDASSSVELLVASSQYVLGVLPPPPPFPWPPPLVLLLAPPLVHAVTHRSATTTSPSLRCGGMLLPSERPSPLRSLRLE